MNWSNLMCKFLIACIKDNAPLLLSVPAFLSALIFMSNIILAVADSTISEDNFHSLVSLASVGQVVILVIVMAVLKIKR